MGYYCIEFQQDFSLFLKWNKYNIIYIPLHFNKDILAAFAYEGEDLMALGIHGCMDIRDDPNSLASCVLCHSALGSSHTGFIQPLKFFTILGGGCLLKQSHN